MEQGNERTVPAVADRKSHLKEKAHARGANSTFRDFGGPGQKRLSADKRPREIARTRGRDPERLVEISASPIVAIVFRPVDYVSVVSLRTCDELEQPIGAPSSKMNDTADDPQPLNALVFVEQSQNTGGRLVRKVR